MPVSRDRLAGAYVTVRRNSTKRVIERGIREEVALQCSALLIRVLGGDKALDNTSDLALRVIHDCSVGTQCSVRTENG